MRVQPEGRRPPAASGLPAGSAAVRALGAGLALAALLAATPSASAAQEGAASDTTWLEVTADSPPAVRLAFEDLGSLRVPRAVADRYAGVLQSLSMTCRIGEEALARVANSAVGWLNDRTSRSFTRLGFLSDFDRSLGSARKSAPDCSAQARSVLLGMADETNLRETEVNTLQSMLRRTWTGFSPGG